MKTISSHPVAFLVAVRWLAWLIALVGTLAGQGTESRGISLEALLGLTALASAAETVLVWRRPLRPPLAPRARRILLGIAATDTVLGLAAVYLSGGWGSPFYHYAVTALLVPAFVLGLRTALAWGAAFVACYLMAVLGRGPHDWYLIESTGRRIGTVATPLLVVLVEWYLAHLIAALSRERERSQRALTQTEALFRVSQAVVENLADVAALLDGIAAAARRTGLFAGFRVCVLGAGGEVVTERGFGEVAGDGALTLPLTVRDEALGSLTVLPAAGVDLAGGVRLVNGVPAFVEALARQAALGLYDARLFAQREELATQAERARIAREIHDGMAQSLYMLSLGLEACADAKEAQQGELGRRLGALVGVSKQALWEARRYIFDLTPPAEGEHSLVAMLENLTREFETVSRVPATLAIEGEPRRVPPEQAATLYRIGQEALANVFKHAQARRASVTLSFLPDTIRLTVADDGRGLPGTTRNGHGLGNMRRRAEEAGGRCAVASTPGEGTRVCVEVPMFG